VEIAIYSQVLHAMSRRFLLVLAMSMPIKLRPKMAAGCAVSIFGAAASFLRGRSPVGAPRHGGSGEPPHMSRGNGVRRQQPRENRRFYQSNSM